MNERRLPSSTKWIPAAVGAVVLAGLFAALSTAVINGFSNGPQPQDVLRRTPTPTFTGTATVPTNTPTITNTPTDTSTPTPSRTPTSTPTPFVGKNRAGLNFTVMLGGSTGFGSLNNPGTTYVPLYDGATGSSATGIQHLTLPGAITHLSVLLDDPLQQGAFLFTLVVNGQEADLSCTIPSKKGDFCVDADKGADCVEVGKQDQIAIKAVAKGAVFDGVAGGGSSLPSSRMSWVAKLDLYGQCLD